MAKDKSKSDKLAMNRATTMAMNNEERQKALDSALIQIRKAHGKGAVMLLGEDSLYSNIEAIPTGAMSLNIATGIGGIPKGRITEIYGAESSGKTTLTLHIIAEAQKKGGKAAFIDAEHALDPEYARKLGVDVEELLVSQPDSGEQALEICELLVRSGALDVIVIDSVAALVPQYEIQGEMGDSHIGLQARLMSQALRKMTSVINKSNCAVIFINQLREKISNNGYASPYGNNETTSGGRALKFYSSMRLEVRLGETIKQGQQVIGRKTKVKVVKNKVAPPFKIAEFDTIFGEGISKVGDVLDCAIRMEILQRAGSWYSFGDERLAQGRENVRLELIENPELFKEIEDLVMDTIHNPKEEGTENKNSSTDFEPMPDLDEEDMYITDEDGVILD